MSEFEINDFPDIDTFSNETQVLLRWLHRVTQNVADAKAIPEFIISLFGILLNVFHLIILTRKSMRSTSINVLMIGIAFCDLFVMTHAVSSFIYLHMNTEWYVSLPGLSTSALQRSSLELLPNSG